MRILAVDPGGTTGFAKWEQTPGGESIQQWQIDKQMDAIATVRDELFRGLDVVVCEDFSILGARGADSNLTIEIIGAIKWLASEEKTRLFMQRPANAAAFADNEKLKKLGWWKVGEDHSRSATRHLVLYLVTAGLIPTTRIA